MTVFNIVHSVYISFYVIWTDMSENKLLVIVIVIVIYRPIIIITQKILKLLEFFSHRNQKFIFCSYLQTCFIKSITVGGP